MQFQRYDPLIIQAYAKALYDRADSMVSSARGFSIALGVIISLLAFGFGSDAADKAGERVLPLPALIGGIAFTAVLYGVWVAAAKRKAFALKLQAQTALCQVQIEINTRRAD